VVLEVALDGPAYGWDPSALVDEDSQDQDYRGALDVLGMSHDVDPADVFFTYVNETVLEVVRWRADGYATRVEWLRTYGGPGCRIYFDGNDYARIEVCSLGESDAVVSVYVPTLAACVYEFADA
jgi:hypothetical protein